MDLKVQNAKLNKSIIRLKLIADIPKPDVVVSMGCNVGCLFTGRPFDDNWGLEDPTGKPDEEFISIIKRIEEKIMGLKNRLMLLN